VSVVNELESLRKRAKQVVRGHRARLVTVAERLRRGLPRFAGMTDREVLDAPFALHDAQQLIAVEMCFASWTEPWGQVTFVVQDPDGNLISFGSPMP
jgi:hypothetical protein